MWQIEKKVSLPTIILMASYLIGGIWFAALFFAQVQGLDRTTTSLDKKVVTLYEKVDEAIRKGNSNHESSIRLEIKQEEISRNIAEIKAYLLPKFTGKKEGVKRESLNMIKWENYDITRNQEQ